MTPWMAFGPGQVVGMCLVSLWIFLDQGMVK